MTNTATKPTSALLGDFVTEIALATTLGMSRRTLHRHFRKGGPAPIRVGRKVVLYRRHEVTAWLDRQAVSRG